MTLSRKDVGVYDRIIKMEAGIDTFLYKDINEKGVSISGGEAQKIAIARALYQDTAFLILDKSTAALDPIAEQEIYEHLGTIVQDRTAIFIFHRLSSCKFADEIVVFGDGTIVEKGSHQGLLNIKGLYQEFWDAQAEFYI